MNPNSLWLKSLKKRAERFDVPLLVGLFVLISIGVLALYSATSGSEPILTRRAIHLMIGIAAILFLSQLSPELLKSVSIWVYAVGIILLILVLLIGVEHKGAKRWIDFGVFEFQPSEVMKLAMPMMIARFFADKTLPPSLPNVFIALVLVAIPMVLILVEPDLGTTLLVGSAGFFVIYFAGLSWRILIPAILCLAVGVGAILSAVKTSPEWLAENTPLKAYQIDRIETMLDPSSDPLGDGFHIIQSKIAIGSGGLYGKGWMDGDQSRLEFIPERHTDFIFAVFSEELGLLGNIALLILYLFIIWRGLFIANRAQDAYSRLLGGSLSLTFFVYLFVNMGMVTGILPVVGVPLPLISHGGTSMLTLMAGFGILMALRGRRRLMDGNFSD